MDDYGYGCDSGTTYSYVSFSSVLSSNVSEYLCLMPKYTKHFVVEYRIPINVDGVDTVQEAVSRARKIIDRQYGVSPDHWFARVFEYDEDHENVGPAKEYFYNPNSAVPREITKNLGYHQDLVEKGIDPTKEVEDED